MEGATSPSSNSKRSIALRRRRGQEDIEISSPVTGDEQQGHGFHNNNNNHNNKESSTPEFRKVRRWVRKFQKKWHVPGQLPMIMVMIALMLFVCFVIVFLFLLLIPMTSDSNNPSGAENSVSSSRLSTLQRQARTTSLRLGIRKFAKSSVDTVTILFPTTSTNVFYQPEPFRIWDVKQNEDDDSSSSSDETKTIPLPEKKKEKDSSDSSDEEEEEKDEERMQKYAPLIPDYNKLKLSWFGQPRTINEERDAKLVKATRLRDFEYMDVYSDGIPRRLQDFFDYTETHRHENCFRTHMYGLHFPSCNSFHEYTMDRTMGPLQHYNISYRGHGAYRDTWEMSTNQKLDHFDNNNNNHAAADSIIWKTIRHGHGFSYGEEDHYIIRKEAIVMERLSGSPRIVDIYGYCGTSIYAENMVSEVAPDIIPNYSFDHEERYGYIKQKDLDKLQTHDVHPMNNLTTREKLDYALVMAESIADIHGLEDGVVVHGDIHPVQWLRSSNGLIKLNDFNNGELLTFSPNKNKYCGVNRCYGGFYRAPEEFRCVEGQHEAVDTYPMGNNIYSILTGLWPYYDFGPGHDEDIQEVLIHNQYKPYVDPRYRTRSTIEAGLVKVMEQLWEWDFEKRISIFEAVRQLRALKARLA